MCHNKPKRHKVYHKYMKYIDSFSEDVFMYSVSTTCSAYTWPVIYSFTKERNDVRTGGTHSHISPYSINFLILKLSSLPSPASSTPSLPSPAPSLPSLHFPFKLSEPSEIWVITTYFSVFCVWCNFPFNKLQIMTFHITVSAI